MVNNGNFIFDNIDIAELAQQYKSPFFFISENKLIENYRRFVRAFSNIPKFNVYYSLKTNFESEVLKTLRNLGAGAEVGGELDILLAEKAGFLPDNIVADGPCKTDETIESALLRNFHIINSESLRELFQVDALAKKHNKIAKVGLRFDPLLKLYNINSFFECKQKKFGFIQQDIGLLLGALRNLNNIKIESLFTHISALVPSPGDYKVVLEKLFLISNTLLQKGIKIEEINIGGGYPSYGFGDSKSNSFFDSISGIGKLSGAAIEEFGRIISAAYLRESRRYGINPVLSFEPGKNIVGDTTIIVGKIIDIFRGWALTDISTNYCDVSRPLFKRPFVIANKANRRPEIKMNIGGPTLKLNDALYFNVPVPRLEIGDIFCILNAGGYSISLANQFTLPRIAVYFKKNSGQIELIRRKETPEDVIFTQKW